MIAADYDSVAYRLKDYSMVFFLEDLIYVVFFYLLFNVRTRSIERFHNPLSLFVIS